MTTDYKKLLNEAQYEAVVYNDGPSLIVAGAGSGKTRVLTYKIAYLLEQGYPAASILALTFTNKAAREMKQRIAKVVGDSMARWLWMGTFHSIFARILRHEAEKIGFTRDFTIYDAADSKGLVRDLIKELGLDERKYKPKSVAARISMAKNNLVSAQAYATNPVWQQEDAMHGWPRLHEVYSLYSRRCKVSNAMDFDDILLYINQLFVTHPEVLAYYQERFKYILVDEYQDTNLVQHHIVSMLSKLHNRICVVGDDAQAIYSFRGAIIDNMLQFQSSFGNCRLFKLEQNYRSTQTIVNAANALISNNRGQIHKNVFSKLSVGRKIKVTRHLSDLDESDAVARMIINLVKRERKESSDGNLYAEVAVLYRTNAQSRTFEKAFIREGIPYKIYGGLSFYQRKEIKDALAYMRLTINGNDEEAFKRIINYPARKIGAVTQLKILNVAHQFNISPLDVVMHLDDYDVGLKGNTARVVKEFGRMMEEFTAQNEHYDAYAMADDIIQRSGIAADIASNDDPDNKERRENIQELLTAINEFCEEHVNNQGDDDITLRNFLSEVSLLTDQDENEPEDADRVTLMTIHSAKGLEFRHIFLAGVEEGLLPMCEESEPQELEEERRLCYVAVTRAKETCSISYAQTRFRNGHTDYTMPSRFIDEIGPDYLQLPSGYTPSFLTRRTNMPFGMGAASQRQVSEAVRRHFLANNPVEVPLEESRRITIASNAASPDKIVTGIRVRHATFGEGTVVNVTGSDADAMSHRAVIRFDTQGEKTLILKYAKLEIIR
ncbi:MAG: UvrD-helicase domain-containing protein [Bacteroidales bacterium]|nr:UvrD-helicase domain-containing protein [Bacteroidales bacterium]